MSCQPDLNRPALTAGGCAGLEEGPAVPHSQGAFAPRRDTYARPVPPYTRRKSAPSGWTPAGPFGRGLVISAAAENGSGECRRHMRLVREPPTRACGTILAVVRR